MLARPEEVVTSPVPHQALYRRWRAQTFSQIVGQEAVVETLRNAVRTGRVAHAVLFVGPRGTGKTSLARILAKAVNCTDLQDGDPCDRCEACVAIREGTTLDVLEIDAASNRGINEVRELRDRLAYPPGHLRRKVYILDEAHQITRDAWNALLKSLEEPPGFVMFVFASTEPSGFPAAVLSRLQRFDVRRLTVAEIEGKLARILEADGRSMEPGALTLVARLAAGGMRDAESMLDQLLSTTVDVVSESDVRGLLGLADAVAVDRFIAALTTNDVAAGVAVLDQLELHGGDPKSFLDQVVEAVRDRLVSSVTDDTDVHALAAIARRLVAIDPDRAGIGGLRLQLELALFAGGSPGGSARLPMPAPTPRTSSSEPRRASITPPPSTPIPATDAPPPSAPLSSSDAASPPASPPAAKAPSVTSLDAVVAAWPDVVSRLTGKPAIKPLILACRPVGLEGSVVLLGFPEEQAFLRDVAERKRMDIEAGLSEVIGASLAIRCVVANIEVAPLPAATDDDFLMSEARRIFGEDLVDVGDVG